MAKYRDHLPLLDGKTFLTDGGLETTLIFHDGIDLPDFAAFDLVRTAEGRERLAAYYRRYAEIARAASMGFIFEAPTWRASADWGKRLGYAAEALADINRQAVALVAAIRGEYETAAAPMVVSGCIGPRGDGYVPDETMSAAEAEAYHSAQIDTFAETEVDMVCALTMNTTEEAIGIAAAAKKAGMPAAISFTTETDGRLPTGQTLKQAILAVDDATDRAPAYYMINCAHPTHFASALAPNESWAARIKGIRANASMRSHAELNEAPDLDAGNPHELGSQYAELVHTLPGLTVLGGCCGTDDRHIQEIARACAA